MGLKGEWESVEELCGINSLTASDHGRLDTAYWGVLSIPCRGTQEHCYSTERPTHEVSATKQRNVASGFSGSSVTSMGFDLDCTRLRSIAT